MSGRINCLASSMILEIVFKDVKKDDGGPDK